MKKYILFIFFLSFCGSTPAQDVAIVDTDNSSTTTLNVTNITSPQGEVTLYHNSFAEYIDSEDYEYVILKNYKICCPENTYPNAGAKPFGYIDVFQDKLLFLANTGEIMYLNLMDFNQNVSTVPQTLIDSNIKKITNKFNFYRGFRSINNEATYDSKEPAIGRDGWGESFKDILVIDEKLYISFTDQINQECIKMSIVVGDINFQYIEFENLYSTQSCINPNLEPYNAQQASGRLLHSPTDNKLFFGVGDFKNFHLPQDQYSEYGKVISIDLLNKKSEVISIGHRNIQGMTFFDSNKILATEHGPQGGDEINLISTDAVKNYGWPISSYGIHYTNYLTDKYASTAPLNKSHKDFGFIEPIFHFNVEDIQSNGFSQIIPNYFSPEGDFFVTSLNGRTIYNLKAKDGPSELTKFINTGERIRDIIFVENYGFYILLQEDTPKLSLLIQKNQK